MHLRLDGFGVDIIRGFLEDRLQQCLGLLVLMVINSFFQALQLFFTRATLPPFRLVRFFHFPKDAFLRRQSHGGFQSFNGFLQPGQFFRFLGVPIGSMDIGAMRLCEFVKILGDIQRTSRGDDIHEGSENRHALQGCFFFPGFPQFDARLLPSIMDEILDDLLNQRPDRKASRVGDAGFLPCPAEEGLIAKVAHLPSSFGIGVQMAQRPVGILNGLQKLASAQADAHIGHSQTRFLFQLVQGLLPKGFERAGVLGRG